MPLASLYRMTTRAHPASVWHDPTDDIVDFLTAFDQSRSGSETRGQFGESFLALDPNNVAVLSPGMLAAALPERRRKFADAGVTVVRRREARQLELDTKHLLVTVAWDADREGRPPINLESTFLLRRDAAGVRILVYLNHHDVPAQLGDGEG